MNTAPIAAAALNDIGGLPLPPQPSPPALPSFSDMLASATSSLAAFALLPAATSDALAGFGNLAPPVLKKDLNHDTAAVPIALPAPVQTLAAASNGTGADPGAPPSQQTSGASGQQPAQSSPQATASANGSAGTGGTSNGSAQTAGGVALPPIAAELNARLALGAQALLSQPSQTLASLPHGALQAAVPPAPLPNLAAAHTAAAPDPSALLPKLATSATLAAATPNGATPSLETALQSSAAQMPANPIPTAMADSIELAALANTGDTTAQAAADPGLGTAPAPASLPLPAADAAPAMENAAAPMVAASALDQVAASLTQGSKLGLSQIEIQLKPAALGAVDVKIELSHDGRVTAVISADRSDTLMQLERGSGELQQALKDAGLQTDSGSLSFNLRGDAQTGDQSSRPPSYAPAAASGDDLLAAPAAVAGASQSAHCGLLNIQV